MSNNVPQPTADVAPPHSTSSAQTSLELEARLRDAVALGNKLFEEREELAREVNMLIDREAQVVAAHRREVELLQSSVSDAARARDVALRQLADTQEELAAVDEQLKRTREELGALNVANAMLRDGARHEERQQDAARCSDAMRDDLESEVTALRAKFADAERHLFQSRTTVGSLQTDRDALKAQVEALRAKNAKLETSAETARREASEEIARLRRELAESRRTQPSANPNSNPMGSVVPSIPNLNLAIVDPSVDYEAFSARARGRSVPRNETDLSSAHLAPYHAVALVDPSSDYQALSPVSARGGPRQDNYALPAAASSEKVFGTTRLLRRRAHTEEVGHSMAQLAVGETYQDPLSSSPQARSYAALTDVCRCCGQPLKHASAPPKDKGCPKCVVM